MSTSIPCDSGDACKTSANHTSPVVTPRAYRDAVRQKSEVIRLTINQVSPCNTYLRTRYKLGKRGQVAPYVKPALSPLWCYRGSSRAGKHVPLQPTLSRIVWLYVSQHHKLHGFTPFWLWPHELVHWASGVYDGDVKHHALTVEQSLVQLIESGEYHNVAFSLREDAIRLWKLACNAWLDSIVNYIEVK